MFFADLLFVLAIALLLTGLLGKGYQKREWGMPLLSYFLIVLMTTWAIAVWIPFGRPIYGVYWISFLFIGLIVSITLLFTYPSNYKDRRFYRNGEPEMAEVEETIGCFFWVFIAITLASVIIYYI